MMQESKPPAAEAGDYAQHCAAYAKALIGLARCADAVQWAQKAAEATPDDARIQIVLADALHLCGRCEEAHKIYPPLEAAVPQPQADSSTIVAEMFSQVFALETGIWPSPVLALAIAEGIADPQQANEFWQLAELEFYDSPYFRMNHAYNLAESGEVPRAFAKLFALVQEMPWLREASINLLIFFEHFDPSGDKQPVFRPLYFGVAFGARLGYNPPRRWRYAHRDNFS
jgi:hypothetical protein